MWLDEWDDSVPGTTPDYGAIFMANRATMKECFKQELFGLPSGQGNFVKQVKKGMMLFLFQFERRELHGVFQACCDGAMNIVPHAFTSSGKQFPAQVQVTRMWKCSPLSEDEFHHHIRENYFTTKKFNFGLSQDQVRSLLSLFNLRRLRDQKPQRQISRSEAAELTGYSVIDDGRFEITDEVKYNPNTEGRGGSVFQSESQTSIGNTLMRESRSANNANVGKLYDVQNDYDVINENGYSGVTVDKLGPARNYRSGHDLDFDHKQSSSSRYRQYPLEEKYNANTEGRDGPVFPSGSQNSFGDTLTGESRFGNNASVGKMYDVMNDYGVINENDYTLDKLGPARNYRSGNLHDSDFDHMQSSASRYYQYPLGNVSRVSDGVMSGPGDNIRTNSDYVNGFKSAFSTEYPGSFQPIVYTPASSYNPLDGTTYLLQDQNRAQTTSHHTVEPLNSSLSHSTHGIHSPAGQISDLSYPTSGRNAFDTTSLPYDPDAPGFDARNLSSFGLNENSYLGQDTASLKYSSTDDCFQSPYLGTYQSSMGGDRPSSPDTYFESMAKKLTEDDEGRRSYSPRNPSFTNIVPLEQGSNQLIKQDNTPYSKSPDYRLPFFGFDNEHPGISKHRLPFLGFDNEHPGISKDRLDFEMQQCEKNQAKVLLIKGDKFQKQNSGSSIKTHNRDLPRNVQLNPDGAEYPDIMYPPGCQKKRGSVFSRLTPAPEVGLQETDSSLSSDGCNSVDEIMNSLQSCYHWANMRRSKPAISQNTVVRHKKETTSSSKLSKEQSETTIKETGPKVIQLVVETPVKETPFLDFKRRSKTRKTLTGNNHGSSENDISSVEKRKRRKLIRPIFKDELTSNEDMTSWTSQNSLAVAPDSLKRREALRRAWGRENEISKVVESSQIASENDTTNSLKCRKEVDNFLASLSNVIEDDKESSRHIGVQSVLDSGNNGLIMDGSPKDHNNASYLDLQETSETSEMNVENKITGCEIVCEGGRKKKLPVGEVLYEEIKCDAGNTNQAFRRTGTDVHCEIDFVAAINNSVNLSSKPFGSQSDLVGATSDDDEKQNQQPLQHLEFGLKL